MPALAPDYLRIVVYMYPSGPTALNGTRAGGTGFLLGVPDATETGIFTYVVTNAHVIEHGNLVVRFNTTDGGVHALGTEPDDWSVSTDDDLAVALLPFPANADAKVLPISKFLEEDCRIGGWPVFPGDNVFFFGRFMAHEGSARNKPVMRFGNIAMLPDDQDRVHFSGRSQLAFLVECRSMGGFSGAPAFVHLEQPRVMGAEEDKQGWIPSGTMFLGVGCGHLPHWSPLRAGKQIDAPIVPDRWVETNSSVTVVVPAWRLLRLLERQELVDQRNAALRRHLQARAAECDAVPDADDA